MKKRSRQKVGDSDLNHRGEGQGDNGLGLNTFATIDVIQLTLQTRIVQKVFADTQVMCMLHLGY